MVKKLLLSGFVLILFFVLTNNLFAASEKMPYRYMGAIGANKSFAASGNGPISPIVFFSHYLTGEDTGLFGKLLLTTTTAMYKLGIEKNDFVLGIAPGFNHTIYGAYTAYDRGANYKELTYAGHQAGVDFYGFYNISSYFSLGLHYLPAYSFYKENDDTEIDLPENHWEHAGIAEFAFEKVKSESVNRIKHGALLKLKYLYAYRQNHDPYRYLAMDEPEEETTQKILGQLGLYYKWPCSVNMQIDFLGGYQKNADINNAEKIGSYITDNATMPGYYYAEFYHHQYVIGKFGLGLPLDFWDARIKPGFNFLYMPEENKVAGVSNYPRKLYRSASLSSSVMLFDRLPFFIDYAYGIDAERRRNANSVNVKKGNHEVQVYTFFAFGRI